MAVTYFLVILFDSDKYFYNVKLCKRDDDNYIYAGYIKVEYGSTTYEYKDDEGDEDNIHIEKKVIEFRDFILSII